MPLTFKAINKQMITLAVNYILQFKIRNQVANRDFKTRFFYHIKIRSLSISITKDKRADDNFSIIYISASLFDSNNQR